MTLRAVTEIVLNNCVSLSVMRKEKKCYIFIQIYIIQAMKGLKAFHELNTSGDD